MLSREGKRARKGYKSGSKVGVKANHAASGMNALSKFAWGVVWLCDTATTYDAVKGATPRTRQYRTSNSLGPDKDKTKGGEGHDSRVAIHR